MDPAPGGGYFATMASKNPSARVGSIRADADPPNAYGHREVRIVQRGGRGKVIGMISFDHDGKRLWEAHPLVGEPDLVDTGDLAVRYVLGAYLDTL